MIRSHFGLSANPFDPSATELLPHQQTVFDVLCFHARQGGLCLLMGEPGNVIVKENYWIRTDTGKSGNAVDFFVKIRGMSFIETMRLLLG